ncbi:hypothetical protein AGMMS49587_08350 [Spirochaetia bacterium]|nr:hypothetical protein AGMMS49587_08350 [Spirochaetia bacterium]
MVFKNLTTSCPNGQHHTNNTDKKARNQGKSPSRTLLFFLLLVTAGFVYGAPGKEGAVKFEKRNLSIQRAGAEPAPMEVELARTDQERSRGLMYRKNLEDGRGMLFIFDRDQVMSFWMKNTLIPLSIAFIASDGRIIEIKDMEPLNLSPVQSSRSVRYALEVPRDWFSRAGINIGDIIQF